MSTRVRKQIYIEPDQEAALKRITEERQLSEAEIIRQALALWLAEDQRALQAQALWEEEKAFIEALLAQEPATGGRAWTRAELYEERLNRYGQGPD